VVFIFYINSLYDRVKLVSFTSYLASLNVNELTNKVVIIMICTPDYDNEDQMLQVNIVAH
jgi:hypothetical protein